MTKDNLQQALDLIEKSQRFLLTCHRRPDADALGSAFGLCAALLELGKNVSVYLPDPVPENLRFVVDPARVVTALDGKPFDCTWLMDTATRKLLPRGFPERAQGGPVVVVDHHFVHDDFGDIVLRDENAAASAVLVFRLIEKLGLQYLTPRAANALYTALSSDTGTFRYSTTTADVLRIAATLVDCGANAEFVAQALYENWPWPRVALLSKALTTIERFFNNRVAVMTITRAMINETLADDDMVEGFVNYTRRIAGVEVGVLLWEWPQASGAIGTRVSFRASGDVDVSSIAVALGGGGHRRAAATEFAESLPHVREKLFKELAARFGSGRFP